jgi:hypothetical protein
MIMVRTAAEVHNVIMFKRREKKLQAAAQPRTALLQIVDHIEEIIRNEYNHDGKDASSGTTRGT